MKLHFDAKIVKQLRAHAASSAKHKALYGDDKAGPGLWLVGDQGVYLMSNGDPGLMSDAKFPKHVVAYAAECNPETMPFDTWWANKQATFGGDDGCEFIALAGIPESGEMAIEMTANSLEVFELLK